MRIKWLRNTWYHGYECPHFLDDTLGFFGEDRFSSEGEFMCYIMTKFLYKTDAEVMAKW